MKAEVMIGERTEGPYFSHELDATQQLTKQERDRIEKRINNGNANRQLPTLSNIPIKFGKLRILLFVGTI
ncbi:MAG: hypothetical protein DSM106950_38510 [Stigonema ocellatum SAG 48.90 = DSM 106950]|nr:hypothetical protein [Stigonema ocellatum SAG 48.90 = DSM 106950]